MRTKIMSMALAAVGAAALTGCSGRGELPEAVSRLGSSSPGGGSSSSPAGSSPRAEAACPSDKEVLEAAAASNTGLPGGVTVQPGMVCSSGWAVASLYAPSAGPARAVLQKTGGRWIVLTLGSAELCTAPGVPAAPEAIRRELRC
ncbi:hypothetical protein [Longispora albida]|uniref:hypothetical protein n=1 Tax=Longispora albida TaxID=203523 RepID=UPI00039DDE89|nr:hypothetical protein [Longispora albida]